VLGRHTNFPKLQFLGYLQIKKKIKEVFFFKNYIFFDPHFIPNAFTLIANALGSSQGNCEITLIQISRPENMWPEKLHLINVFLEAN